MEEQGGGEADNGGAGSDRAAPLEVRAYSLFYAESNGIVNSDSWVMH